MKKKQFSEDSDLAPVCTSQLSLTLSLTLNRHIFWVIKGKEKEQIIFLFISIVVFLCCIQHKTSFQTKAKEASLSELGRRIDGFMLFTRVLTQSEMLTLIQDLNSSSWRFHFLWQQLWHWAPLHIIFLYEFFSQTSPSSLKFMPKLVTLQFQLNVHRRKNGNIIKIIYKDVEQLLNVYNFLDNKRVEHSLSTMLLIPSWSIWEFNADSKSKNIFFVRILF